MLSGKTKQVLTSISANLGGMAMGAIIGYSSPIGPLLLSDSSSLKITTSQNNWVGSIITIGACFGCPIGGYTMRKLGRRKSLMYSLIPYTVGWTLIIAAQSFGMLVIGRFMCGVCLGLTSVMVPTFIGEYASPGIRGVLTSSFQLMMTIGTLMAYSMGLVFDSFRWIGFICAIPSLMHSVTIYFVMESPTYLLVESRKEEAKESLKFYRGPDQDVSKELQLIEAAIEENNKRSTTLLDFKKTYLLKPLLIAIFLHIFQQASGVNAVIFNMAIIFKDAGSSIDANLSALIIGAVLVVGSVASAALVELLGRKILLIISSLLMMVSLIPLGLYFYLKQQVLDKPEGMDDLITIGWVPLISLIVFIGGMAIGYGPIPWILMSEMFTSDAREIASSTSTICNWGSAFIVTATFDPIKNSAGAHVAYWIYAAICGLNVLFCIFIVPETKGKPIESIVAEFGHPFHDIEKCEGDTNSRVEQSN